ncbi:hypothetical protein [Bradyrhizobium embrapense]|uniref:hypothetical protein n=1 Tax=Bradyrhizobium embrapense TaxID=630921 RepID=UPI001FCE2ADA|nr:hypothetical protein [Bradyrhizobium embrapense]
MRQLLAIQIHEPLHWRLLEWLTINANRGAIGWGSAGRVSSGPCQQLPPVAKPIKGQLRFARLALSDLRLEKCLKVGQRTTSIAGFSRSKERTDSCHVHGSKQMRSVAAMGAGDQLACLSVVAFFSLALIVTSGLFVESRAMKNFTLPAAQQVRAPL